MDTELHHEARDDTEEARVIVEPVLHKVVKTIRTVRRPRARDFNHKLSFARVETDFVGFRSLFLEAGGILESGTSTVLPHNHQRNEDDRNEKQHFDHRRYDHALSLLINVH